MSWEQVASIVPWIFAVSGGLITLFSWLKSKREFYSDTFLLIPWGVFVWGDGLIIGPFWLLSGVAFALIQAPLLLMVRYFLMFKAARSAYEVVYWINHQVAQKEYRPPLFRMLNWIGANEAGILYQLLNMCNLILWLFLLSLTF